MLFEFVRTEASQGNWNSDFWVDHSKRRFVAEPTYRVSEERSSGTRGYNGCNSEFMLIWLLNRFAPLLEQMELHSTGDSSVNLTARTALASVTSFLLAILFGPPAIRWLKSRFRERVDSDSEELNRLHADKNSTPTMGGLFVVGAILISSLLWGDLSNRYVQLAIGVVAGFALLGAVDDWIKLNTHRKTLLHRSDFTIIEGTKDEPKPKTTSKEKN